MTCLPADRAALSACPASTIFPSEVKAINSGMQESAAQTAAPLHAFISLFHNVMG